MRYSRLIFIFVTLVVQIIIYTQALIQDKSSEKNPISGIGITSGTRSAYQLAPFGEGFNFDDLFRLFNRLTTSHIYTSDKSSVQDDNLNVISLDDQLDVTTSSMSGSTKTNWLQRTKKLAIKPWKKIRAFSRDRDKNGKYNNSEDGKLKSSPSSPVILVPGYGGSRLEARLDRSETQHYFCDAKSDWTDIWIDVKQLLPYMIDCLIDNLKLEYDPTSNTTRNTPGVEIRVKNESYISSIEYLNNLHISGFAYFAPIVDQLVSGKLGYEREINIKGAPYDFRKAPNEMSYYFNNLKDSTEQLSRNNNGEPVTFICHSMGCNNMLYFLQRQPKNWKSKYVKRLISIAAPWGGSVAAMKAAAIGDDLGMPYLFSESKLLHVQRSLPSTIFLFPNIKAFPDAPLIISNTDPDSKESSPSSVDSDGNQISSVRVNRSPNEKEMQQQVYKADDFKKFFEDVDHPDGYQMWLNTKDLLGSLEAPGVEVWCLIGKGKQTLGRLEYKGQFPKSSSIELFDDGDGTVTIQSAEYCKKWSDEQKQPIYLKQFEADHLTILKNEEVMQYVEQILASTSPREVQ